MYLHDQWKDSTSEQKGWGLSLRGDKCRFNYEFQRLSHKPDSRPPLTPICCMHAGANQNSLSIAPKRTAREQPALCASLRGAATSPLQRQVDRLQNIAFRHGGVHVVDYVIPAWLGSTLNLDRSPLLPSVIVHRTLNTDDRTLSV